LASALTLVIARAQEVGSEATRAAESSRAADAAGAVVDPLKWIGWGSVHTGFGFRDNVLLSHGGEERSSFVRGGIDATVWRVPEGRVDYHAAVSAAGTRYFSATTVKHEAQAILLTEWRYLIREKLKFSFDARAYYFDQIFDVSNTDLQQVVAQVKTTGASAGPKLRWAFHPAWWVEAQAHAARETYPDGVNDRDIRDGTWRMGWKRGTRFEVSVAGSARRRAYDTREQNSVSGRPVADTVLTVAEREGEARMDITLDAAARWKTSTRGGVMRFTDNGLGFLNYRQKKISQELEWTTDHWLVEFEGVARRIDYGVQTVGVGTAPPPRVRDDFSVHVRVERKLTPRWTAFAEYTWERNRSNDELAAYSMNEGLLGIRWNWEK